MNFKYRVTPVNVLVFTMLFFATYIRYFGKSPNSLMASGYLYYYSIFFLLGDLFLQFIFDGYKKVLLIESIGLSIIIIMQVIS